MKNKWAYKYLWILASTVLLMGASSLFLDMPLAQFFEVNRNPILTHLGKYFSLMGESQWYLVPSVLIGIICWRSKPLWSRKGWYVFITVASTGILAILVKLCCGRYRPELLFEKALSGCAPFHLKAGDLAFPSGHATTIFAVAVALGYLFPRYRWLFYVVAATVALSRVVLVKHWLSDVIAGAWLGAAGAVLCWTWMMNGQEETHEQ